MHVAIERTEARQCQDMNSTHIHTFISIDAQRIKQLNRASILLQ